MILGGTKGGFPEQDIPVSYEQMITDGKSINVNPWTVENPHPGFGKDPNILNEYGHSQYPMWVDNPDGSANRLIVKSKAEYEELIGKPSVPAISTGWNTAPVELKQDGPTLTEYMAAGYKASTYPPVGYASKSTEEEIKAAIAAETTTASPWPTAK